MNIINIRGNEMKYTKILTIMLTSVLICVSISAVTTARTSIGEREIKTQGIFSDLFYRFFNAIPAFAKIFQREAPAIDADSIKKEEPPKDPETPALELRIEFIGCGGHGSSLLEFKLGERMYVQATIWNRCEYTPVKVDEMDARLKTLDFIIETPDGYLIHYIRPYDLEREHAPLIIEPGDYYESSVIWLNGDSSGDPVFGIYDPEHCWPPKPYRYIPGHYSIYAKYVSNLAAPPTFSSDDIDCDVVIYNGELESETLFFKII